MALSEGASHDLLRPVRRITGVVPRFLQRQWQHVHGGDRPIAFTTAPGSQEAVRKQAASTTAAGRAARRGLPVRRPARGLLLPEISPHGRAMFGPLRRVQPQTVAAQHTGAAKERRPPVLMRRASHRGSRDAVRAAAAAVLPDVAAAGPAPRRECSLRRPSQERLALEPAWSVGSQPESPPKFSQQRCVPGSFESAPLMCTPVTARVAVFAVMFVTAVG